jgi:diphthamide biosynthesis protein 7
MYRIETNAILDMKWTHSPCTDTEVTGILATGDAKGNVDFYTCSGSHPQLRLLHRHNNQKEKTLCLSLDWSNRVNKTENRIAVSQSDGTICILRMDANSVVKEVEDFKAHDYEAWIVGFNYWNTNLIYTGTSC